jgi:hypothetical protein
MEKQESQLREKASKLQNEVLKEMGQDWTKNGAQRYYKYGTSSSWIKRWLYCSEKCQAKDRKSNW